MEVINISAAARPTSGTSGAKQVRKDGHIPCVMYGGKENTNFSVTPAAVKTLIYTSDFKLAEIDFDGNKHKCVLKDIQIHPVTDEIEHLDFLELVEGQPLKAEIPVEFKGSSPGVKNGGRLNRTLRKVQVKTTPEALVNTLFVSIEELELGEAVRVRDIEHNQGIEIMVGGSIPIANVAIPRVLLDEDLEEGEEGVEGEEGEGGEEEGSGEEA